ncbi:MAG: alginate lyase family protein [Promethearchaeota archaeon]
MIHQSPLYKFYKKKKISILKNLSFKDSFVHKYLNIKTSYNEIRDSFFEKNLFAYSKLNQKEKIINILKKQHKSLLHSYIDYANKILENNFSVFDKEIKFKNEINWHYSFFNDFYWKLSDYKEFNIFPKKKGVDIKYTWEFNRHQFLIFLGMAFFITQDERYAQKFRDLILNWIKKNPPLYGVNWISGLEISIRLSSWIFTLLFFKESRIINNNQFFKQIFKSMFQHAFYLRFFYQRRSFNHTVGEVFGIYLFCKFFNHLKRINKWEKKFFKIFKKQIILQTRRDGSNIEQSVHYHKFILEFFVLFLVINPNSLNRRENKEIKKMFKYLLYLIKPNGELPQIGDSDDGRALPLTQLEEKGYLDLFNIGCILFKDGCLKFFANKLFILSILLFGVISKEIFNKIKVQIPPLKLIYFSKAGHFIIRNNWSNNANYLFVDIGKFGGQNASHSHSSITNFIFSYKGKDIIVDAGTYSYNIDRKIRNYFRSSKAHNILSINNKNQALMIPYFGWRNKPQVKKIIKFRKNYLKIKCVHNGYKQFLVFREWFINKKLNKIIIIDSIIQRQSNCKMFNLNIDLHFHFRPDLSIKVIDKKVILDDLLEMSFISKEKMTIKLNPSFYSPRYGHKLKNKMLNVHFEKNTKDKIITRIITIIKTFNKKS